MIHDATDLERIFAEQLRAVATSLSDLGAELMLIGGLAVGIWSEPRATKDADLSVHVLAAPDRVRDALARAGREVTRGDVERALEHGEAVRLRRAGHTAEPIVVDLLFAITAFEIDALRRRRSVAVFGVELPVATPEDLFVFKIIAGGRTTWPTPPYFSTCTGRTSTSTVCGDGVGSSMSMSGWRCSR